MVLSTCVNYRLTNQKDIVWRTAYKICDRYLAMLAFYEDITIARYFLDNYFLRTLFWVLVFNALDLVFNA